MALRELIASFGVEIDSSPLKGFEDRLQSVSNSLTKFAATLGIALGAGALSSFIGSQIDLGSAINDTAAKLGVASDELQKFQYAAKIEGGLSAEEAAHSIGFLNRVLGQAASGNAEAAKGFAAMGVAIKDADGKTRPALEVLSDVADRFQATDDPAKRAALSMSVFGRQGQALIPLLSQGGAGIRKLYGEADRLGGAMGKDLVKAADEAGDQIDRLKFAGQGLANRFMAEVLPALTSAVTTVTDWVAAGGEFLSQTTAVQSALTALAIAGGIAAAVWAVMNIEIFGVLLGLALLYLAVDEIYGVFTGADSAVGRFIDSILGAGATAREVQFLRDSWDEVSASIGAAWTILQALEPAITAIENAAAPLEPLFKAIFGPSLLSNFNMNLNLIVFTVKAFVSMLQTALQTLGGALKLAAGNDVIGNALDGAFGKGSASSLSQFGTDLVYATTAKATLPGASSKFGDKKTNLINQTNHNSITIHGASDPGAVRDAVYDGISDGLSDANDAAYGDAYGEDVQ